MRNKKKNVSRLLVVLVLLACTSSLFAIKLPDGTEAIISKFEKYESGKIKSVSLSEPTKFKTPLGDLIFYEEYSDFGGFSNSKVEFYESGKLKSGYLKSETKINTPVGKYMALAVEFYESGKLKSFQCITNSLSNLSSKRNLKQVARIKTKVGDIPIRGNAEFYENGSIKSIEFEYYSFIIKGGLFDGIKIKDKITFHKNGNVSFIKLNGLQTIKTKNLGKIKTNTPVELWDNNNVKSVEFPEGHVIDSSIGLLSVSKITTYKTGVPHTIYLSEAVDTSYGKISTNEYDGTPLEFYENGNIKNMCLYGDSILECDTQIGKIQISGRVSFYENGNIKKCHPIYDYRKIKCSLGEVELSPIYFYETGEFMGGYTGAYSQRVSDEYYIGYLMFDKSGQFIGYGSPDEAETTLILNNYEEEDVE